MNFSTDKRRFSGEGLPGSQLFVSGVVLASVLLLMVLSLNGLSSGVQERQTEFLEQCVKRSAVQCYVIEGRFPSTEEGVSYLREHYGLQIDESRYVIYYESFADNLLPQVRVLVRNPGSSSDQISRSLRDGSPDDIEIVDEEQ
ncbi:MAG: hypothetical protein FWD45_02620 [Coriobacteriia bacterium]|nr:hypothetical protein [Coriobacteriia bacterium]